MRMRARFARDPQAYAGMRIGLFGGSFDPAHSGHRHAARVAQHALGLDRVWWLVTPQNPLKAQSRPLAFRMASARACARGARHLATDIESRLGARFTVDTVAALQRRYPGVRFVLIVGDDVLESFHRWRRWRDILRAVPLAIVARRRQAAGALKAPALAQFARARRDGRLTAAPAWRYLRARLDPAHSTALRAADGG
ncbi:MAG: nicotinate-nucleotide adenylyltransferase [Hyphomonadaceae bacterium]|nr:nicotinate-nucleotide adenylyltransferase [Hyphomonadaceae bacterium]